MRRYPEINQMEAVILCGGLGTRLREETEFKPKPMVEIGGYPILWHIMQRYAKFGVRRFVLCLGYKGNAIRDYFLNFRHYNSDFAVNLRSRDIMGLDGDVPDWEVVLAETGDTTMTGSRIARAMRHVRGDHFFATYGDGVANVDIGALYETHKRCGTLATLTAVNPPSRYGEIKMHEDGTVDYFIEKPQMGAGMINGGFFVLSKEMFRRFGPADPMEDSQVFLEKDMLSALVAEKQLSAYTHGGYWQCMDTYREMQLLNELWAAGEAPWAA